MIENSMLDLIVVSEPVPNAPQIQQIYNNLQGESFFIKSRMLSDDKVGSSIRSASFKAVLTS